MKKILGLDLGTASIGWALVNEADTEGEKSSIMKVGVRVVPLNQNEEDDFLKGKSITTTADRTLKRSMRRNLQRYKLRRENLISTLRRSGMISEDATLCEDGPRTTFQTYRLRAKAANEEITLEEFARVLLMLNGKRGYRSNRKLNDTQDGEAIDGIAVAQELLDRNLTPGQYAFDILKVPGNRSKSFPFYRSDLEKEFDLIWNKQREYYGEQLGASLRENLRGCNSKKTWAILKAAWNLIGLKRIGKASDQDVENYSWRVGALTTQIGLEELAVVLQDINAQILSADSYLGRISDRSKELHFSHQTVGEYLMAQLEANPNASLKNQVFYRNDYLDEFNRLWDTQSRFHPELTEDLRKEIRDKIIFYQRPLRSQKGLIALCEFEHRDIEVEVDGVKKVKTVGLRVCPKSSPLFQEFKVRQIVNNLIVSPSSLRSGIASPSLFGSDDSSRPLTLKEKDQLIGELRFRDKMEKKEVLKLLLGNASSSYNLNYESVEGDRTASSLFSTFEKIFHITGGNAKPADARISALEAKFNEHGINPQLLHFDSSLPGKELENQPYYRLWHLLYSYEGDNSVSGNDALIRKLSQEFGFDAESARVLVSVRFQDDYGSLSAKAIRKILPYLKEGYVYSDACEKAGYRHSARSLTREEIENKTLADHLSVIPKNSLRNPVVEKILNQMINVVNAVIDEYGRPDEIRIEMARELKKSAKERQEMTDSIKAAGDESDRIRKKLVNDFHISSPTRNDIVRYKLWEELSKNGNKTLYSNTYIPQEKLFSKDFDIEHIVPQSRRFDDSFANKTLELRSCNIEKGNKTAFDYIRDKYGEDTAQEFANKVESLQKQGVISRTKARNLLLQGKDIDAGFLERDLRDSQYIARKAREILESVVRVVTPTTGSVTARLREDWQLVNVMKEINWDKYDRLGKTGYRIREDGSGKTPIIEDWTKRNDNRHHAMDAITIAFTKPSYIQYLNNLNARRDKMRYVPEDASLADTDLGNLPLNERCRVVAYIEEKQMHRQGGHLVFNAPILVDEFRAQAKSALEGTLVSIKAKNKVTTENVNVIKHKGGNLRKRQLTPRGQLHNETIYGQIHQYDVKEETVGSRFDAKKIATVASKRYREALQSRLELFGFDPKKAFTGKNSLDNNPLWLDASHQEKVPSRVKTVTLAEIYTKRVPIDQNLVVDKVVDRRIRQILQARLDECKQQLLMEYGGDEKAEKEAPRLAFSNIDENPIWLDKEHGIAVKRVTITGKADVYALHDKRDKRGVEMLDEEGKEIATDFVSTSNNHHIAIYRDADGNLQESVIPFIEAVRRSTNSEPIVDRHYKQSEGWKFLFSMKKNELFVFPNEATGFDPNEIDLTNPDNYALISPNLFRVQKLSTGNYVFRHHLETNVNEDKALRDVTWKRIQNLKNLEGVVKVRINHLGQIVHVGE